MSLPLARCARIAVTDAQRLAADRDDPIAATIPAIRDDDVTPLIQVGERWHREVPGARWFRTDLHIHTLDDHPNPKLKRPATLTGPASDPNVQRSYARALLRAAVARGIEVLGLTPHAVRCGETDDTCATWRIIDEFRTGIDDDGVAFREKIYAVFPGFEPSLSDGSRGVHLLFLFDPAIERDCFLRAFQGVMGGVSPWNGNQLRNTGLDADAVFAALDRLQREEESRWDYVCLAPHAFNNEKGLFDLRSQILQDFPSARLSGIELGDHQLPQEVLDRRQWLGPAMTSLGHAFFHGSDAYEIDPLPWTGALGEIGSRYTLVKLASPTIEALRQAFLASDSRIRLAYEKDDAGQMQPRVDLPDPVGTNRPWLRAVRVGGGASFFGGSTDDASSRVSTFRFSPDLTCVIGSRMSGKSTLLDGLRAHFGHSLPQDSRARADVESRAAQFRAGGADIQCELRGRVDPTRPMHEQWPARFFTQRELQEAVRDQDGLRHILFHLLPERAEALEAEQRRLSELDESLVRDIGEVSRIRTRLEEAEQAQARAATAREALSRYRSSGADRLQPAQRDRSALEGLADLLREVEHDLAQLAAKADQLDVPELGDETFASLLRPTGDTGARKHIDALKHQLRQVQTVLTPLRSLVGGAVATVDDAIASLRQEIERALVAAGGTADELFQFDRLSRAAGELDSAESSTLNLRSAHESLISALQETARTRDTIVTGHRTAMRAVLDAIQRRFQGKIRLRVDEEGELDTTEQWIRSLHETGISRWWNDARRDGPASRIGPSRIRAALQSATLDAIGMSPRVAQRFREVVEQRRRLELLALRASDRYVLELHVGPRPDDYRELSRLSGGQQVSLLLSLLLETDDPRPLVIDQPEDELDSGYLFDTVLPALRRLKGARQIILATHNANIVVNGDADQVIYLSGTFAEGSVAAQGAIEEPVVKDAILRTVDGGQDAFKLRHRKYGF